VTGSYDAPLVPMAAFFASGVLLWLKVDVTRKIEEPAEGLSAAGVIASGPP